MAGLGRTLGASLVAAVVAAVTGGLALLLVIFLGALFAGTSTFDKPFVQELASIFNGIVTWGVLSLLMGFLPALLFALVLLVPLHVLLVRTGRTGWIWYAAAGAAGGIAAVLIATHLFGYLQFWAQSEGLGSLLIAAGVGGPAGALVLRRILKAQSRPAGP
jgi:hypothetical protein